MTVTSRMNEAGQLTIHNLFVQPYGTQSVSIVTPLFPAITSVTPTSGQPGATVTINGTHLNGATAVAFNGTAATFTVVSAAQITATVPAAATTGPITVTTPAGIATSASFTVTPPAPTLTSFSPGSGVAGASVTINGSNLNGATAVAFNGSAATFALVSATQITATVPAAATTGPITVTTPVGTATSATSFTVTVPPPPAPTLTGFSPSSGAVGASVTINGTSLNGAAAVAFNGTSATTFTVVSSTQITATVPATATTGPITVTTPSGTATSASSFTVTALPPPTLTSFSPASGGPGTSVTIRGSNFTGASLVTFNGVSAGWRLRGASQIEAIVPAGAISGPISVTTPSGTATSAANFVVLPAPSIAGFSPGSGAAGATITIAGDNFLEVKSVTFNGSKAGFTVISPTSITAVVPKGAKSGPIGVTTNGGSATSASSFTVIK